MRHVFQPVFDNHSEEMIKSGIRQGDSLSPFVQSYRGTEYSQRKKKVTE